MTSVSPIATNPVHAPAPRPRLAAPVPPTYGASPQQASQTTLSHISQKYAYDQSKLADAGDTHDRVKAVAKSMGRHVIVPRNASSHPAPESRDEQRSAAHDAETSGRLDVTV